VGTGARDGHLLRNEALLSTLSSNDPVSEVLQRIFRHCMNEEKSEAEEGK